MICQKDAFLCAAKGVSIGIHFQRRLGTGIFGGEGFIMQKIEGDGMAFLHAGGYVVEKTLVPGELLRVDTGCVVAYTGNIDFDIDKQVEKLALDMERRYELLCIYKEAVINASRHSNGRHIKISLRYSNRRLMMMIIDDGKGFNMDDAAMLGRGMSDMRRRAAAINSILYIESEINTGTVVKLEMPV